MTDRQVRIGNDGDWIDLSQYIHNEMAKNIDAQTWRRMYYGDHVHIDAREQSRGPKATSVVVDEWGNMSPVRGNCVESNDGKGFCIIHKMSMRQSNLHDLMRDAGCVVSKKLDPLTYVCEEHLLTTSDRRHLELIAPVPKELTDGGDEEFI
jgi:hypothetical protein